VKVVSEMVLVERARGGSKLSETNLVKIKAKIRGAAFSD
jgi:hypothetical protein